MQDYIIAGCSAVLPDRTEEEATVIVEGGRIASIGRGETPKGDERIDARGLFLVPGFIDIHCHGGGGADSWEDPARFAKSHANFGTTGILSTIAYNVSHEHTVDGIKRAVASMEKGEAPTLLGIHLEGPYTNPKYGASREGVRGPNPEEYAEYLAAAKGSIKVWTFAPEVEGAESFVRDVRNSGLAPGLVFSVGHSEAEPEVIYRHIPDGLKLACHLMDAMGVTPEESRYGGTREVGVIEAVLLEDAITAEVIPDSWGAHVRALNLRLIVKTKSVSRTIIITDAMNLAASGDPKASGDFKLGADIFINEKGELSGSRLTMNLAYRNMILHTGVSLPEASRMASLNPARILGIDRETGSIEEGKRADLVLLDRDYRVRDVWVRGTRIDR